jgi:hypothetical protein
MGAIKFSIPYYQSVCRSSNISKTPNYLRADFFQTIKNGEAQSMQLKH